MKKKVNFYIDGFNFYYGLKDRNWKKYYWLDIQKFCSSFIQDYQQLEQIYYCTAVSFGDKKRRQDLFFSANKTNPKFNLVFGKFKTKTLNCRRQHRCVKYEEKQTDVNIAVEMIRNVVLKKCDFTILVSADSDLVPPIKFIKSYDPTHKILVFFPPGKSSSELRQNAHFSFNLDSYESRFKSSVFPDNVVLNNGHSVSRPINWN